MFKTVLKVFVAVILTFFISCEGIQKITDKIIQPSAREIYAREFSKTDSSFIRWQNDFENARNGKIMISEPFTASAISNSGRALGYEMDLQHGEKLEVEVWTPEPNIRFFINFYSDSSQLNTQGKHSEIHERTFSAVVEKDGWHKIVIQPESGFEGNYSLRIYTLPSLSFPVAGKSSRDIQSFWGANRDGGLRSHEGVDIFAARGTPLLAATDGFITRVGERGLGGKQVWLRDGIFGSSLYYAHLDSIIAESGQQVKTGDTLGLVGNSGNAEFTAPHLHFGIYTNRGAVDPLPFIKNKNVPELPKAEVKNLSRINSKTANIRRGPSTDFQIVGELAENDSIEVLVQHNDWFHIRKDSVEGFVSGSLLK